MGIVFCKNSYIGELFLHFRIHGYDFQKFLQIYGYTFEKFLGIYGWYFYDLNGTIPYLGNLSSPPPPAITPEFKAKSLGDVHLLDRTGLKYRGLRLSQR